ncbi:MAG: alcohol dehydrogenase catalytic domain-containing protein [Oscillospiraceae bacterium]|nr:alcohol dehydrogenase catalytic domain-containing protein [Oscillospiraceae bacterium]
MKAGMYYGIKDVRLEDLPKPAAGKNDVVIKVVSAGICGTDVHAYLHNGDPVGIHSGNQFGHEFVGQVVECGENVKDISAGMRVTINPTARIPLGRGLNSTEIADMSGAFSEYVLVEEAKMGWNVFQLPDSLPFEKAVLTEPLSVSTHGVNCAGLSGGEKALVYGAGTIGLCAIAALQNKGVSQIIVSDINDGRLAMAKELGAIPFNSKNGSLPDFVKAQFGTVKGNSDEDCIDAGVVIDCAGVGSVISEFMDNAKTLSKLIVIAVHGANVELSPYWLLAKEVSLIGSRGYTPADIQDAIAALARPGCRLPAIITARYPHGDFVKAMAKAAEPSSIKVAVDYE